MAKQVGDAMTFCRYLLGIPNTGVIEDAELIKFINDAQKDLVSKLPEPLIGASMQVHEGGLTQGQTYFAKPTSFLRFITGERKYSPTDTIKKIYLVDLAYFENILAYFHNQPFISHCYIADRGDRFLIYPPGKGTDIVKIYFVATPADRTRPDDILEIHDALFETLCYYTCFLICLKRGDPRGSDFYNLYNNKLNYVLAIWTHNLPLLLTQQQK